MFMFEEDLIEKTLTTVNENDIVAVWLRLSVRVTLTVYVPKSA
jgi:hypothetical protein